MSYNNFSSETAIEADMALENGRRNLTTAALIESLIRMNPEEQQLSSLIKEVDGVLEESKQLLKQIENVPTAAASKRLQFESPIEFNKEPTTLETQHLNKSEARNNKNYDDKESYLDTERSTSTSFSVGHHKTKEMNAKPFSQASRQLSKKYTLKYVDADEFVAENPHGMYLLFDNKIRPTFKLIYSHKFIEDALAFTRIPENVKIPLFKYKDAVEIAKFSKVK